MRAHLPEVSALFDLSLDIERHESDRRFVEDGGRIIYVFDENIFELFVYPKRWKRLCQAFYGEASSKAPDEIRSRALRLISQQSALVTAEHLFSGALPGQHPDGHIYLTQWHREELLDRLNELVTEAASKTDRQAGTPIIRAKLNFWRQLQAKQEDGAWRKDHYKDAFIVADLEPLEEELSPASLATFARTRELAFQLSDEEHYEPVQQLRRVTAPAIQARLKGLIAIARPLGSEEKWVNDRAADWWTHLDDELYHRQSLGLNPGPRSESAAWNDCLSLAMVEWISSRLNEESQRVVLVTGDATLLDAYRRAYNSRRDVARSGFLLRRPFQYTPIFNPNLSRASETAPTKLFHRVRGIVHTALAPLQLTAVLPDLTHAVEYRNRESLTLRPLYAGGPNKHGVAPIERHWREVAKADAMAAWMRDVKTTWSRPERIRIGWADAAVRARLSPTEIALFEEVTSKPTEQEGQIIDRFVENSIRDLATQTMAIWRPIAKKAFKQWTDRAAPTIERVPLAVFLPITYEGAAIDLVGLLASTKRTARKAPQGGAPEVEFLSSQFELFVAASVLALIHREWRLAQHFSDMATKTYEFAAGKDRPTEVRAAEAYYCLALALRFRIGEVANSAPGHARRLHERAEAALSLCRRLGEDRRDGVPKGANIIREFRVASEKAALDLFHAARELDSGLAHSPANADFAIRRAHELLGVCLGLKDEAPTIEARSPIDACRYMARQFLVNSCALYLLRLQRGHDHTALAGEPLCVSTLNELGRVREVFDANYSPILLLELAAFEHLFGGPRRRPDELTQMVDAARHAAELEIDDIVTELIGDLLEHFR